MNGAQTENGHVDGDCRHIFVFDNMRTRSHLFWRWISTHPALYSTYHPYLEAGFLGPERILPKLRSSEARMAENEQMYKMVGSKETYESSHRRLKEDIENAEQEGKPMFVNEHIIDLMNHYVQLDIARRGDEALPRFDLPFPNPTYMPDELLARFTPVILIRHPVLQVQSIYNSMTAYTQCRPGDENFDIITSLHMSRLMFEYFRLSRGQAPIVIDGEDILWRTYDLGAAFCHAVGIDVKGLKNQWERLPELWWSSNPFIFAMTQTIHESTGIERPESKPTEPNIDEAVKKWKADYGADVSQQLREKVEVAMPHYEYLIRFKI